MRTFLKFSAFVFTASLIISCAGTKNADESTAEQQNKGQVIPSGFIHINGGAFVMGSPAEEADRGYNEVQHRVTVNSFYMSKYVVTIGEWNEIMGERENQEKNVPKNHPVNSVNWYDAIEYCNKRSLKEGLTPAYDINKNRKDPNNKSTVDNDKWLIKWNKNANGYRLPTEAEWEYACRAGTETAYNTGNNTISKDTGWYKENCKNTEPVGKKTANKWGLYDMHGDVWELCWDWYGEYSTADQKNPEGPVFGSYRVHRGGSWDSAARYLRSAFRLYVSPTDKYPYVGFRIVRP